MISTIGSDNGSASNIRQVFSEQKPTLLTYYAPLGRDELRKPKKYSATDDLAIGIYEDLNKNTLQITNSWYPGVISLHST